MKNLHWLLITVVIALVMTGCKTSQSLSFTVLEDGVSFAYEDSTVDSLPKLVIIASPDEIASSMPDMEFPISVSEHLQQMDFTQSFGVLLQVNQKNDMIITQVISKCAEVTIEVSNYDVGPGNYVLRGFTPPYRLISIAKDGKWGEDILFILRMEKGEIIEQTTHFIP